MIFLLLAIVCSSSIGVLIHFNERKGYDRFWVMTSNYWIATLLGFVLSGQGFIRLNHLELSLAIAGGIVFVLGFLVIMVSIHQKGLAIPVTIMRLSVIFPVLISVLFWGEHFSFYQLLAFILTLMTIAFFAYRENMKQTLDYMKKNWFVIFALILILGTADTLVRALEYYGEQQKFAGYLTILFFSAAIITTFISLYRIKKITLFSVGMGVLLGIPNYLTSHFLLKALNQYDAIVVFPLFNLSIILISVFIGVLWFNERLTFGEKLGVIFSIPAIVLINFH